MFRSGAKSGPMYECSAFRAVRGAKLRAWTRLPHLRTGRCDISVSAESPHASSDPLRRRAAPVTGSTRDVAPAPQTLSAWARLRCARWMISNSPGGLAGCADKQGRGATRIGELMPSVWA
jgi:hypothetical protein